MLTGFVEQRLSQRVPFQAALRIKFMKDNNVILKAQATDISTGGIQFFVPWMQGIVNEHEQIEIIFDLPEMGGISVRGEIRHFRISLDENQKRILYCGIKFLDIAPETWMYIQKLYGANAIPLSDKSSSNKKREYARIETYYLCNVTLDDGRVMNGLVEDVGFGGAKIFVPLEIGVDTPLIIEFSDPQIPFRLNAVCIWTTFHEASKSYYSGICFNSPSSEQFSQIRNLIFTLAARIEESRIKI